MLRRAFAHKKAAALSFLRKILEFMHATFSSFKETILCERERATTKKERKILFYCSRLKMRWKNAEKEKSGRERERVQVNAFCQRKKEINRQTVKMGFSYLVSFS